MKQFYYADILIVSQAPKYDTSLGRKEYVL